LREVAFKLNETATYTPLIFESKATQTVLHQASNRFPHFISHILGAVKYKYKIQCAVPLGHECFVIVVLTQRRRRQEQSRYHDLERNRLVLSSLALAQDVLQNFRIVKAAPILLKVEQFI
jgi:hypothetical protein